MARVVPFAGLVSPRCQAEVGRHGPRSSEPARIIDGGAEGQCRDGTDTRCGHQQQTDRIIAGQPLHPAIQFKVCLVELKPRFEQRHEGIREEIEKVFRAEDGVERVFSPDKSGQIPDRPAITMIVMAPEQSVQEETNVQDKIDAMTKDHGKSARTYKSALLWVVPESTGPLREEARKLLAWQDSAYEDAQRIRQTIHAKNSPLAVRGKPIQGGRSLFPVHGGPVSLSIHRRQVWSWSRKMRLY